MLLQAHFADSDCTKLIQGMGIVLNLGPYLLSINGF